MDVDISKLPYKHRFAAASMLMTKGNRLTDLATILTQDRSDKQKQRALQGVSFYDMALALMKPHDPNYQTLLNWKCLALISLGQFADAKKWYEELVRIALESEGPNGLGATARLAQEQITSLAGRDNEPLPAIDLVDVRMFDDPPFCQPAERFCQLLQDRKFKDAHYLLSQELASTLKPEDLKNMWSSMIGAAGDDATINMEQYVLPPDSSDEGHVGWCYFSVVNDEISEAISMDIYRSESSVYEIRSIEFGRP